MSDSLLIAQPGKQKMTLLRESYQAICDGDPCAARLLNAMERWHFYKLQAREEVRGRNRARRQGGLKAEGDEDLWVRMAIDPKDAKSLGWCGELMDEYSYKVVKRGLDLLVDKGFVAKRENPRLNWDRTPQWLFQVEIVQKAVDAWGQSREDPAMSDDPDGTAADRDDSKDGENPVVDDSANLTDSTRQIDRVEMAQKPIGDGRKAESSRQIDRSNNTDIPLQKSSPEILQQTSPPTRPSEAVAPSSGPGDGGSSAFAEQQQATPARTEGGEDLPFPVHQDEVLGKPGALMAMGSEKVPPGGAALLMLVPVPRAVLESRPRRDPLEMITLRAVLKASNKTREKHLTAQLQLGTHSGLPRDLFTRLTDQEINGALKAAQQDTSLDKTGQGFDRIALLALDVLIGEPVTAELIASGRNTPRPSEEPLGQAYQVKNGASAAPRAESQPEGGPPLDLRAQYLGLWELKNNPAVVVNVLDLEERAGAAPVLHLKDDKTLSPTEITLKYRRPAFMTGA